MRYLDSESGFSMIEILITLLLMCIALLGMTALQSRATQYAQDSVQRNTASVLVSDLVELMRVNISAVSPSIPSGYLKDDGQEFPAISESECVTASSLPRTQLACWGLRARKILPGAGDLLKDEFHVCTSNSKSGCSAEGRVLEIQVAWRVKKKGACMDNSDSTTCYYRLRAQL